LANLGIVALELRMTEEPVGEFLILRETVVAADV
jgi:hypothetical protein